MDGLFTTLSRLVSVIFACLAVIAISCAPGQVKKYSLEPEGNRDVYRVVNEKGFQIWAQYLDREARDDYFMREGIRGLANVFNTLPLNVFLVAVTNVAAEHIIFNPRMTLLADGKWVRAGPYTYANLYMDIRAIGGGQHILKQLQKLTFERPVTLKKGQRVEKLLLFPRPETIGKEVYLLFESIYVNGESVDVSMKFEAVIDK
jgi:hypothetical protein